MVIIPYVIHNNYLSGQSHFLLPRLIPGGIIKNKCILPCDFSLIQYSVQLTSRLLEIIELLANREKFITCNIVIHKIELYTLVLRSELPPVKAEV